MFEINFHFARWRIGRTVEERVRKRYLSLPVSALLQFLSPLFHNFSSSLSLSLSRLVRARESPWIFRDTIRTEESRNERETREREREGGNGGEKKRERGGEMDEQASDEKKKKEKRTDENDSR